MIAAEIIYSTSCTATRLRCSSLSANRAAAAASAARSFGASTVPRYRAQLRRIETRQDFVRAASLAGVCLRRDGTPLK